MNMFELKNFSSDILRSNFPDIKDRVYVAWSILLRNILEHIPYEDHKQICVILVEELISLSGVSISDSQRERFKKHHYNKRDNYEL